MRRPAVKAASLGSAEAGADTGSHWQHDSNDMDAAPPAAGRPVHKSKRGSVQKSSVNETASLQHDRTGIESSRQQGSDVVMSEAAAQRLIDALNAHNASLSESSQTLCEASRQLKDACLLLQGRKHRL